MSRLGRIFITTLLAASALTSLARAQTPTPGTIRWDTYGVPHIYGPDRLTVVRGLGYAQMENHAETLLNNLAHHRGRVAEYFGPGNNNANINSDIQIHTYDIPRIAAGWIATGGTEQQQIVQSFCDGINEYVTVHGDTIDPLLKKILPVVPADIAMEGLAVVWHRFVGSLTLNGDLMSAWERGGLTAANSVVQKHVPIGSNGWAIGPSKSASGNAILVANPHEPWGNNQPADGLGFTQWIEANLVIGDPANPTLNASGVTFMGGPFIGIGFSDDVGWTHTNDVIKNADLYQLTLDSTGTKYKFGANFLPLSKRADSIKVLQPDGSLKTQSFTVLSSVHGPVVDTSADHKTMLVLRTPPANGSKLVIQYWNMIQSKTMADFIAAESMLQMPYFNTIYADRGGNIVYWFGGQQPVRNGGSFIDYAGILDGTDPTKLWTKVFTWQQLPHAINPAGGYVINGNDPPWTAALPQPDSLKPANYPAYVAPYFIEFRPQQGHVLLQAQPKFTAADILAAKNSTRMLLADRLLPDLITAARVSTDADAVTAATILAAWDHTGDAASVGGALFEEWWNEIQGDMSNGTLAIDRTMNIYYTHPAFRIGWDPLNPVSTPVGLANAASLVPYLANAKRALDKTYAGRGGAAVLWGDAHRSLLVFRDGKQQAITGVAANTAQSGVSDELGGMRVTFPSFVASLGYNIAYGGDGYVAVIEFTPKGAVGGTAVTYGNASRPNSPHISDQLQFFNSKTLKPALRTLSDVQAATVTTEAF